MQNLANYLTEIEEHFRGEYPREGCGLLGVRAGVLHWLPCTNHAHSDEQFQIDSVQYMKYAIKYSIVGIVHSHPDTDSTPSDTDIRACNALATPYYIFGYPAMDLTIVQPRYYENALFGREYEHGITDCFEAVRDYLNSVNIQIPPRIPFEKNWWEDEDRAIDYFNTSYLKKYGFTKKIEIANIEKNDLLVFNVRSHVNNHCGIYLGSDMFFHHAADRLSTKESLYPFWVQFITGAYRHET